MLNNKKTVVLDDIDIFFNAKVGILLTNRIAIKIVKIFALGPTKIKLINVKKISHQILYFIFDGYRISLNKVRGH